jgi:PIN domain nuclease of toxin-antitoxin system
LKLLLDTHIWLWSAGDEDKIQPDVLRALEDPKNEKWLSPISIWELMTLIEKRRLSLNMDVEQWIVQALSEAPLREAPLTAEVVLAMNKIQLPHRDPVDAFLAATAHVFDLTLVTSDERLLSVKGLSTLPNR